MGSKTSWMMTSQKKFSGSFGEYFDLDSAPSSEQKRATKSEAFLFYKLIILSNNGLFILHTI